MFFQDGKDGLKFYTDANYFFELWKSEMLQSTERAAEGKGRRGGLKSNRYYLAFVAMAMLQQNRFSE